MPYQDTLEQVEGLLHFIKHLKHRNVSTLPPAFFSMVNTLALSLRMVANKDSSKIRSFINFWLDKLELEILEEREYDYPKYLLRNTMMNVIFEMGEYLECIKLSNFSIKEITSDIKANTLISTENRKSFQLKEKGKLLVLSMLYKVDCLLCIQQCTKQGIEEILNKCLNLIDKLELRSETALLDAINKKFKMLNKTILDSHGTFMVNKNGPPYSYPSITNGNLTDRPPSSRKFVVRSNKSLSKFDQIENTPNSLIDSDAPKQKFFEIKSKYRVNTEQSAKTQNHPDSFRVVTHPRSQKSVAFSNFGGKTSARGFSGLVSQQLSMKQVGEQRGILRNQTREIKILTDRNNAFLKNLKKEFSKEISELAQLSTALKKEVKHIQTFQAEVSYKKQPKPRNQIFDDSNWIEEEKPEVAFNKEIEKKLQSILESQVEWDKQRKLLNEKLERLEKTYEKHTEIEETPSNANRTSSFMPAFPSITKDGSSKPQLPIQNDEEDSKSLKLGIQKIPVKGSLRKILDEPPAKTDRNLPSRTKSQDVISEKTFMNKISELQYKTYEQVLDYCFHRMAKMISNSSFEQGKMIKHKTDFKGKTFDVLYEFSPCEGINNKLEGFQLSMKLFEEDANFQGIPLASDVCIADQLKFILKRLKYVEALPSNIPVTALIHINYFVSFILHRFIYVNSSNLR